MTNFENYHIDYEYQTVVRDGETPDDAFNRAEAQVSEWLWPEVEEAKALAAKGKSKTLQKTAERAASK